MKNDFEIRGDVTVIFLDRKDGSRLECLIDTADLERAQEFPGKWKAEKRTDIDGYYVYGFEENNGYRLHRFLTNAPSNMQVDHKNNNGLDNRRSTNLRLASPSENLQNRRGCQKNNRTSGIRGVTKCSKTGYWHAKINVNRKTFWLGSYSDLEEARLVVENARAMLMPFSKEADTGSLEKIDIIKLLQKRKPSVINNGSGVKGVYLHKKIGKWYAQLTYKGKRYHLGTYGTIKEAEMARINAETKLKGGKLL